MKTHTPIALAALSASGAGLGTTQRVSNTMKTVLNNYGLVSKKSAEVTDGLTAAIRYGKRRQYAEGAKRTGKRRKKVGVSNPAHGNHKAFQKREARRRRRARAARPSGPRSGTFNLALDNTYGDLHSDPIGDLAAARRNYLADNSHIVELTVQVPRSFYDRYREMFVKHPDLPINVVDFESREWTKEQHEEVLNRPRSHAQERTTTIQLGYSDHLSGVNDEYTDTECEDNYRRPF